MPHTIPTPELITKAQQDYMLAAAERSPGAMPLAEARKLTERFADTRDIRIVSLPINLADFLETTATASRLNPAAMLGVYIHRLLENPNASYEELIGDAIIDDESSQETNSYNLAPDDFVPLAELACIEQTSCSLLASAAVQQAFRLQDLF